MRNRLLMIDDDERLIAAALTGAAEAEGWTHRRIGWPEVRPDQLADGSFDLIVPIAAPVGEPAVALFQRLQDRPLRTPVLAVISDRTAPSTLQLISESSADFLVWPASGLEWRQRVRRILGSEEILESVEGGLVGELGLANLVGRDPGFRSVVERIPRMSGARLPVLITGETGTGKELCARAIHHCGPRRDMPFIPVDCASLPDSLVENELFGHARGAFTDARGEQRGLIALAQGGTLFLDEIDSLSLAAQGKLLRFLQERRFRPLGSDQFLHADVGLIAASNQDLAALVDARRFRADLFFRLNVLRIELPPLRRRRGDIALLAEHFARSACADARIPLKPLARPTLRALSEMEWPGNVRELHNVVQRAVLFAPGPQVLPRDLAPALPEPASDEETTFRTARAEAVARFEREFVENLLRKHGGNVTRAAREAGKDRRAFGRLAKKHGIDRGTF